VPSQSPLSNVPTSAYADAWAAVNRLIRAGKSWSGREANTVLLNRGDASFCDVSYNSGLAFPDDARGLAQVDWDSDGDCDFWISNRTAPQLRFMRNDRGALNRSISLLLRGTECNRDAIGARVELQLGERRLVRTLDAGSGFLSQSSRWLVIGVGASESADELLVRWPDGSESKFTDVASGQRYLLTQGAESLQPAAGAPPIEQALVASRPQALPQSETARIVLSARLPAPVHSLRLYDGKPFSTAKRKAPLLINFWSSTCGSCLAELSMFARERQRLSALGLQILALSVDDASAKAAPRAVLEKFEPWFEAGAAPDEVLAAFDVLQRALVDRSRALPVPASFLIDADGNLACIYKGPVSVEQLEHDLRQLALPAAALLDAAVPFAGRWTQPNTNLRLCEVALRFLDAAQPEIARSYLELARARLGDGDAKLAPSVARRQLSDAFLKLGLFELEAAHLDNARAAIARAIDCNPRDAVAHYALARVHLAAKQPADARKSLESAVAIDASLAPAWNMLASLQLGQGEAELARRSAERAIECDPNSGEGWLTLGMCLMNAQQVKDAKQAFERAVQFSPQQSLGWSGLGTCRAMLGELAEGVQALEKALELNPQNQMAQQVLQQLRGSTPAQR
jgi:Tfp pilus assembly protein PilF/peroxiredoxin